MSAGPALRVFDSAAIFSNTPFRTSITGADLHEALIAGVVPVTKAPHLERILAELPIGLLARLVFACPIEEQSVILTNLTRFGEQFGIDRIKEWLTTG